MIVYLHEIGVALKETSSFENKNITVTFFFLETPTGGRAKHQPVTLKKVSQPPPGVELPATKQ